MKTKSLWGRDTGEILTITGGLKEWPTCISKVMLHSGQEWLIYLDKGKKPKSLRVSLSLSLSVDDLFN